MSVIYNKHSSKQSLFSAVDKKKYVFALDKRTSIKNSGIIEYDYFKNYFHSQSISEVKEYLSNDNNLYELCWNKQRKLYFDFDGKEFTQEEANIFIQKFVDILEKELEIKVNPNELIVLKNEAKTKVSGNLGVFTPIIYSLHIIIANYKMDYQEQYDLSQYINDTNEGIDIDLKCYKKDQLFRLVNQSKLEYGVKLVPFYDEPINITKSLINYTHSCKTLTFTKEYDLLKDKFCDKDIHEICKNDIYDFMMIGVDDEATFNQKEFFNNEEDWKCITNILLKYPKLYNIDKWKRESANISENSDYSYEKNSEYCDKINSDKVLSGITKLYKIVHKYSSHFIINHKDRLKTYTIDFLQKYYDENVVNDIIQKINNPTKIKVLLKNGKSKTKNQMIYEFKTKNNEDTIVNIRSGFIQNKQTKSYINMYYDNIPIIQEYLFNEVQSIEEAKGITEDFIDGVEKGFVLKSRWGSGKTSYILKTLLEHYKDDKILIITESNTLNNKLIKDFENYGFVSHLDAQKNKTIKLSNHQKVICSIQSIGKVEHNNYDLVILDEFESVFSSYISTNTFKSAKTTNEKAFNTLISIVKTSGKTIFCDADISEDKVGILKDILGDKDITIWKNNQKTFDKMKINIYTDKQQTIDKLCEQLDSGKKIALASASKTTIEAIALKTKDSFKTLKVVQEGVYIYENGVETSYEKDTILKDVEAFIIQHNIQLFMYSPTIKTGISINSSYFDMTFGFTSKHSILYNEMIQMIFRQRKLNDNVIHLYLDDKDFTPYNTNKSYERVEREQHIKKDFYKELIKDSHIFSEVECSKNYYKIQTINNKNAINSRYNYNYNLIQLLKYHHLDFVYIPLETFEDQEETINGFKIDIEQALKEYKDLKEKEWLETKLMDYPRYFDLSLLQSNERYDKITPQEKSEYMKTSIIYGLFKVKLYIRIMFPKHFLKEGIDVPILNNHQLEQIETTIQEIIKGYNNTTFYNKYVVDYSSKDSIFCIHSLFYDDKDFFYSYTSSDNKHIDKLLIQELLISLDLYDPSTRCFKPTNLTNAQFKTYLVENKDLIQKLYNHKTKKDIRINFKNPSDIKTMYHIIKETLLFIDIYLEYKDKRNTTRDYDIMIFHNTPKEGHEQIFKYPIYKQSNTLNKCEDKSIPFILEVKQPLLTIDECEKILNKSRITKQQFKQLQLSLLFNNRECMVMNRNENANGDDEIYANISYKNNGAIMMNDYYYNDLLETKITNVSEKQEKYYIMKDRKQYRVWRYDTKTNTYYKPYEANIPTINTLQSNHNCSLVYNYLEFREYNNIFNQIRNKRENCEVLHS